MNWTFDEKRNIPFFGSENDLEVIKCLVGNCLAVLDEGTSVRQMVLETWLTVDYSLRQLLLSGLEVRRFSGDDLDLQYDLLPRAFEDCLRLLKKVVKRSQSLPPESPRVDRSGGFSASLEFWRFIRDSHPELFAELESAQREFIIKQNPDLAEHIAKGGGYYFAEPREDAPRMNRDWVSVAAGLDEDWFKDARRLNDARNKAAHSIRPEDIAGKLGLCGPNIASLIQKECLSLLQRLLGVKCNGEDD